ncbi:MAG: hypothetical protein H7Y31_09045 [Chitinophagaceae bacterium]|nr:hypothetical protein [Chitinophagaceae bacterium]
MKQQSYCLSFVLLLLLLSSTAQSQGTPATNPASQDSVISIYYENIRENAPFFNGAEYTGHGQGIIGHAFFESDQPYRGWLEYDGVLYKNLDLRYDLIDDAVIIKDYSGNFYMRLNSNKIRAFGLGNYEFVQPSYGKGDFEGAGFFQRVYNGTSTVLVKRRKQVVFRTTEEKSISSYIQYNDYYVRSRNRYQVVEGNNSVLRAFSDHRSELKKFINNNKLNVRKQAELALIRIASHYDQLKNQ